MVRVSQERSDRSGWAMWKRKPRLRGWSTEQPLTFLGWDSPRNRDRGVVAHVSHFSCAALTVRLIVSADARQADRHELSNRTTINTERPMIGVSHVRCSNSPAIAQCRERSQLVRSLLKRMVLARVPNHTFLLKYK